MKALISLCLLLVIADAQAAFITVNTAVDEFGSGANCGLREAVQAANTNAAFGGCSAGSGADVIDVPAGFFTLSRGNFASTTDIDEDNNSVIDLDIRGDLAIQGDSSATVSIGNTDSAFRGRIIHVISGTVSINRVTIRDGVVPNGRFGGCVRTNPGSNVTINDSRVFNCEADGGAGGILNAGQMQLNNVRVDANSTSNATTGGGGIYNTVDAELTIFSGRILNNSATGPGNVSGGGLYNDPAATLQIRETTFDNNTVESLGNFESGNGGGLANLGGPMLIEQSTFSNNLAKGEFSRGGGLYFQGNAVAEVTRSVIFANVVETPFNGENSAGGGLDVSGPNFILRDSVVSFNLASASTFVQGGGVGISGGTIFNTTITGNKVFGASSQGGGVRLSGGAALVQCNVLANESDGIGGGVVVNSGGSFVQSIIGSTISSNISNADGSGGEDGGGIAISAGNGRVTNSVIAGNSELGSGVDDCFGPWNSGGHNLLQNTAGCTFAPSTGDLLGVNASLAVAANNGGPVAGAANGTIAGMLTRAPLPGSPLIDGGNPSGCRDQDNAVLTTDQIGNPRNLDGPDPGSVATCDIGALESTDGDVIFRNGFE